MENGGREEKGDRQREVRMVESMRKKEKKSAHAPHAAHGLASALSSAYQRVPEFPYLDRATTLILIVCVIGYLGFTAYIFFSTPPVEIETKILEGGLTKKAVLGLSPGEKYLYNMESPDGVQQVAYAVGTSPACAGVVISEAVGQESQAICILKNGMLSGAEGVANANFGNQSVLLFSPWMLAVSDDFSWNVDNVYSAQGVEMVITTHFASKGKQVMAGREAYDIEIGDSSGAPPAHFFIDSEKRVLLYANLGNITVKMARALFALNWTG